MKFRRPLDGDRWYLYKGVFCDRPTLCQWCAVRRGSVLLRRYLPRILATLKQSPAAEMYLVTATLKNGANLNETIGKLWDGWSAWARDRKKKSCELRKCLGGVMSTEVKRGKGSGLWHPHMHGVLIVDGTLDYRKCQAEWRRALGRVPGNLNFVRMRSSVARAAGADAERVRATLVKDLCEVFKYAVKFGDLSPADRWQAFRVLHRRRLLRSFGSLYGSDDEQLPEGDEGQPDWDTVDYVEWLFRWCNGAYRVEQNEEW